MMKQMVMDMEHGECGIGIEETYLEIVCSVVMVPCLRRKKDDGVKEREEGRGTRALYTLLVNVPR
jgi:hypothetical protein